ncbi:MULTISPECIES: PilN domain-containing protein [Pantoea]|uniref:PilN domain-containing protein n=1 Tax=Pantoea eucalypti TaxID=470933 RepID=A0ABY2ZE17_9GAMM|nr:MULTISPECIES: PilN domain-containing protein [Pantoea]QXG54923.1 PilN domain-containing protein [Pantoea jilinensis]AWP31402.1 fimbrial assembly protein [Pantoea vagans]ELP24201.1 Type IV pilus biogenesis protein PilN [Pantoea agglomerans 299R]QGF25669.1 fimbrial assembly protein [Pantoea eucalypti]TPD91676.1 PilN domain-containing protein [Pantoea vagans]
MVAVNLLPWRQHRRQQQQRQSLVMLLLMLGTLFLVVVQQTWQIHQARQQVAQTRSLQQQALDALGQQLAQQKQLLARLAVVQKQQAKQRQQAVQLAAWQQFWLNLPVLMPDSAWLTRLEKRDNHLTLEGQAQDMASVRQFRQQLTTVALLDQVKQGGVKRQADGSYRFSLRATVQAVADE